MFGNPEEEVSVLLDPSLLVSERSLARLRGDSVLQSGEIRKFVPASFVRLIEERGAEAALLPSWQFFLGNVYPVNPEEIFAALRGLGVASFEPPPEAAEAVARFRPEDALSRRLLEDPHLKAILQEEVAYLATQSVVLARIKRTFEVMKQGGCIAMEGVENYIAAPIRQRVQRLGWKRFARKAAIGLYEIWHVPHVASPLREILSSAAVVFIILDP